MENIPIIKNNVSVWELEPVDSSKEELYMSYYTNESLLSLKYHSAYILDQNKNRFDFIEKLVYDLSKFHLKNINMDIDKDNIKLEFWFKTTDSYGRVMHTDGDDNAKALGKPSPVPLMSILLYLNNNNNPTLITNIDEESYKYKNFTDENKNLSIVFPKKMRSIVFNGGYFHSEINLFNDENEIQELRNMLVIDVWHNYNPIRLPLYNSNKYQSHMYDKNDGSNYIVKRNTVTKQISLYDSVLNNDFFSNILYRNDNRNYKFLSKVFDKENIYEGLYVIINNNNTNNEIKKQNEHPLKKFKAKYDKYIDWREYVGIFPNVINEIMINTIKDKFVRYGELLNDSELLLYIMNNISANIIYKKLIENYSLDDTYKINIEEISLSDKLTTDDGTTIVASIFLNDDVIEKESSNEEIEIKRGTLVFQNDNYINKFHSNQVLIEFFINIENM
jgi:hypothetical protein